MLENPLNECFSVEHKFFEERAATLSTQPARTCASAGNAFLKRCLDITLAVLGLLIFSPIMIAAALAIKIESQGSIIFKQTRLGRAYTTFTLYKFRTMVPDAEMHLQTLLNGNITLQAEFAEMHKLRLDPRITKVGKFLRTASIDEIPQLINVLKGDMSIVGPRPYLLSERFQMEPYSEKNSPCQTRSHWSLASSVPKQRFISFQVDY